jgi:hypothetical protein
VTVPLAEPPPIHPVIINDEGLLFGDGYTTCWEDSQARGTRPPAHHSLKFSDQFIGLGSITPRFLEHHYNTR